eukprot:scaffold139790_cov105-Phaeocystis_antarctica.AAC.2
MPCNGTRPMPSGPYAPRPRLPPITVGSQALQSTRSNFASNVYDADEGEIRGASFAQYAIEVHRSEVHRFLRGHQLGPYHSAPQPTPEFRVLPTTPPAANPPQSTPGHAHRTAHPHTAARPRRPRHC